MRELVHVIERAAVMSASDVLDEAISRFPRRRRGASQRGRRRRSDDDASLDLRAAVEALERSLIEGARAREGNRAEAARLLGIARPQLYAKMKDLGIDPDEA